MAGAVADSASGHLSANPYCEPLRLYFTYVHAHRSQSGSNHITGISHMCDGHIIVGCRLSRAVSLNRRSNHNRVIQRYLLTVLTSCSLCSLSGFIRFFYLPAFSTSSIYLSKKLFDEQSFPTNKRHTLMNIEKISVNSDAPHTSTLIFSMLTCSHKSTKPEFDGQKRVEGFGAMFVL